MFHYKTEQQCCLATDLFQTISNFRELCHLCLDSNFCYYIVQCFFYHSYQFIGNLEMLQCFISIVKPIRCTSVSIRLFWNDTLRVSGSLPVHHREFKTVHTATGICQTDTAGYCCLLAESSICWTI